MQATDDNESIEYRTLPIEVSDQNAVCVAPAREGRCADQNLGVCSPALAGTTTRAMD